MQAPWLMYDAAEPPASPPQTDVVAGYIGGDTPHVWTDQEWARQTARYRLPIYTRSNPSGPSQAREDAGLAITWAHQHGQPAGTLIALDFETAVNQLYVDAFDQVIHSAGYFTALYGSLSTVFQNPRPRGLGGYWVAHYDGHATIDDTSWLGKQYADDKMLGLPWDLSVINTGIPLWDTVTHAAANGGTVVSDQLVTRRRNDVHVDLKLNAPVVFTNPAAVLGGTSYLLLASDFGTATVRVAVFSFKTASWTVQSHVIASTSGAYKLAMPGDTNKVSVILTEGTCPVGLDILA